MKQIKHLLLVLMAFVFIGCQEKETVAPFEGEEMLVKYLSSQVGFTDTKNKAMVFILQSASCICTEENIAFVNAINKAEEYSGYQTIVIVGKNDHQSIESLKEVNVFHVDRDLALGKHGLTYHRDKFFQIEDSKIKYWSDVYDETLPFLESKFLLN